MSGQAPNAPRNRSPRIQIAHLSGRQDSNLRPLVPQTSPHFPMRAEFDLEWFCGELVGMTTRARVMESAGIAEKYLSASTETFAYSLEPPAFRRRDHGLANVSVKPRQAHPGYCQGSNTLIKVSNST